MQQTLAYIEDWTKRLQAHPFFVSLHEPEPDLERALAWAKPGVFWVFTFQDILRINVELTQDTAIQRILAQHQAEDAGHEEWFLQDLEAVYGDAPTNARWLFSRENSRIRAGSFALAAEVFRADDDRLRLVIVEALESAAGLFFASVARFLARSGHTQKLAYFAGPHVEAEAAHELHGEHGHAEIQAIAIPPELRADAQNLVDRMYAAFFQLADAMFEHRQ